METPNTKAGRITEEIMKIFGLRGTLRAEMTTAQYNAIYSHVLKTLMETL